MMPDDELDALLRRLDVPSSPRPDFVASSHARLAPRARAARARDASWAAWLVHSPVAFEPRRVRMRPIAVVVLVLVLLLAIAVGLVMVGAIHRLIPIGNGPLVVSVGGQLEAIDPSDGSTRRILTADKDATGVTRSPDGQIVTYWTNTGSRSHLDSIGLDGRDGRELLLGMSLRWAGSLDTWSPDSRSLATEVMVNGSTRILIVDIATGAGRLVTPANVTAHSPLWSPDGDWIAFTPERATGFGLAVIRTDGTDMHDVAGDLHGLDVAGPDTWAPDGWIYFSAGRGNVSHDFRANVSGRFSTQLTSDNLRAYGVASSPDGTRIVYLVDAPYGFDLWIAASDGSGAHRLLESGGIGGWSNDGQYVLVRWKPADPQKGGLGTIRADGTDLKVLVPFDPSCRTAWDETCESGFGWGQPRP